MQNLIKVYHAVQELYVLSLKDLDCPKNARKTFVTILHIMDYSADPRVVQYQNTGMNKVSFSRRIHHNQYCEVACYAFPIICHYCVSVAKESIVEPQISHFENFTL